MKSEQGISRLESRIERLERAICELSGYFLHTRVYEEDDFNHAEYWRVYGLMKAVNDIKQDYREDSDDYEEKFKESYD